MERPSRPSPAPRHPAANTSLQALHPIPPRSCNCQGPRQTESARRLSPPPCSALGRPLRILRSTLLAKPLLPGVSGQGVENRWTAQEEPERRGGEQKTDGSSC